MVVPCWEEWSHVANVSDNKQPARRMMVGTRTTIRDWQWLDEMMVEDTEVAAPPQRIWCMGEGGGRWRGGKAVEAAERAVTVDTLIIASLLQVHSDLNEPVSAPSQSFMALGSTPPSAHMPGHAWEIPFTEPTIVSTPPVSTAPAEHRDEPPACGRGRRIPRRRGCDTGGHI
ncbi:hypothetical protein PIB30_067139 [Stylosanthes scabra]|uniref:Uncharacterized protein n=1 Tax=Stylosanthes scabra TaxID=79078 RepID=A0ABU6WMA4_9FABA|nr:hypothetical protein [Stylosanthes scabra]